MRKKSKGVGAWASDAKSPGPWAVEEEETGMVPVDADELVRRINRALNTMMLELFVARDDEERRTLGEYYVADRRRESVEHDHVDIEALGHELEVLRPSERLDG